MNFTKSRRNNLILLAVITLLIIPQTRKPIQVFLQKGIALFGPSVIDESNRISLSNYDWELQNMNGESFNFKETRGKVVFVNFWATWCPPCIAEMPNIQELYNDYKDKIAFVMVSDESLETTYRFLEKRNYNFKTYTAKSNAPRSFNVTSIPRTFLLDKNGSIVIDKTGAANWNSDKVRSQIDLLLAE